MRIGIDIDGVLTNEDDYLIDTISKYCYENNISSFIDIDAYEFNKLDWDMYIISDYRHHYFDSYVKNYPPRLFASEVIKKLKDDGHEIFIITARHKSREEEMQQHIKDWLVKNNIIYDKVIFTRTPKIDAIVENNIDIMIEDSPVTIPCIKDKVNVFCYDTRYNRHLDKNITRVFSWYDIYSKIKNMGDNDG